MPDAVKTGPIRDFGAAEGNTAAENAAAIQRAIDEVREQCDEDSRFPFYKYGLRLHPLDRSWFRPGPFEADVRK